MLDLSASRRHGGNVEGSPRNGSQARNDVEHRGGDAGSEVIDARRVIAGQ
jgi:hypothetical protein